MSSKLRWRSSILRLVMINGILEVFVFRAFPEERTNLFQCLELFLGVDGLIHVEVKLAEVLVGAAVFGIDLQSLLIVLHGFVEGAELTITIGEHSLSVRVVRIILNGLV